MIVKVNNSGYVPQPIIPSEYDFYFDFTLDSNYDEDDLPVGWVIEKDDDNDYVIKYMDGEIIQGLLLLRNLR